MDAITSPQQSLHTCNKSDQDGEPASDDAGDQLIDAMMAASRAMVGLAVRSLSAAAPDITISQYRTLVVLASRGPQRMVDLASLVGVQPSTIGRMCDRLVRKGYLRRVRQASDRRTVRVSLTGPGRELVEEASSSRRGHLSGVVAELPPTRRPELTRALRELTTAASEAADDDLADGVAALPGLSSGLLPVATAADLGGRA